MMIDKLRKRFNHSASLGKTLARTQHPHLSYAEPRQFDMHSLNQSKSLCKKQSRVEAGSTPKPTSNKAGPSVPVGLCLGEGLLAIQVKRQRCGQLSGEVHAASMAKSLRVNRMYKQLHHFGVCVDELRWLLAEGDTLLRAYLAQANLIAPHSAHTADIAHISHQFRGLLLRFQQIDRQQLATVDECLRVTVQEGLDGAERKPLQTFPDVHSILSIRDQGRESEGPSLLQTRHFSVPLKQNVNTSNMPHFDNIKITKTQTTKPKISSNAKQPPMAQSLKVPPANEAPDKNQRQLQRQIELHRREKDELYKKLRQQHQRSETLQGSIEMLKGELASLQRKLATYTVSSKKSIEKLVDILRRLAPNAAVSTQQRQLQLLKMSQVLSGWQKMIEDELQQAKYRQLYGHPEAMQGEKTQKLKQIIELQYDINQLMAHKQHLEREQERRGSERGSDELYRMLVMQASVLEELCSL